MPIRDPGLRREYGEVAILDADFEKVLPDVEGTLDGDPLHSPVGGAPGCLRSKPPYSIGSEPTEE